MQKSQADVIVVGAGPVGAYAAWKMAEQGLQVAVLERQRRDDASSDIGAFHFERPAFDRLDIEPPPRDKLICTYSGMTIHSPDGNHAVEVTGVETWALDLAEFIDNLRQKATEAGATIHYGTQVVDIIRDGDRVVGVKAQGPKGDVEYTAKVTVDATGMTRAVRRHLPSMNDIAGDGVFSVYMEYWTDAENEPADGIHSYLGPNAWTAKYKEYVIVGIGQPLPLEQTKAAHAAWVDRHLPGKHTVSEKVVGVIPYAYPPLTLVDDGVVVIGDAAATNKPFNGEGIASGMTLAKIAAEELPQAIQAGGTRSALWNINRRYFTDQGAKFAFIRATCFELLDMTEQEHIETFAIGLVNGEDLRQTFLDFEVKKSPTAWITPVAKLLLRPALAWKYGRAVAKAERIARCFRQYPTEAKFAGWRQKVRKLLAD